jgi:hypothetical protein
MRGGDGGTARSGGAGHFIEWLTLASAFEARWDEDNDALVYYAHPRRAYSIHERPRVRDGRAGDEAWSRVYTGAYGP